MFRRPETPHVFSVREQLAPHQFRRCTRSKPRSSQRALYVCCSSHGLPPADADLRFRGREVIRFEREGHLLALPRPQMNPLEAAKTADRGLFSGAARDIQLDYFVAVPRRSVLYRRADFGAVRRAPGAQTRILEAGIAQAEAEWIKRLALEIAVSSALHAVVGKLRHLIHALIERYRKTTGGIVDPGQGFRDRGAGFLAAIPRRKHRRRARRRGIRRERGAPGQNN